MECKNKGYSAFRANIFQKKLFMGLRQTCTSEVGMEVITKLLPIAEEVIKLHEEAIAKKSSESNTTGSASEDLD